MRSSGITIIFGALFCLIFSSYALWVFYGKKRRKAVVKAISEINGKILYTVEYEENGQRVIKDLPIPELGKLQKRMSGRVGLNPFQFNVGQTIMLDISRLNGSMKLSTFTEGTKSKVGASVIFMLLIGIAGLILGICELIKQLS